MRALPIDALLPEILEALRSARALVLEAPPGAGKSTRVPRALLDAGLAGSGQLVVTEPRRLAARLTASYVARETGSRLGGRVGYEVRFERALGPETRLLYATEGVLLRRVLAEPGLPGVGLVVLDEFHERHLETDVLLALLARLSGAERPDLKLVVMSATLDAAPIAAFLGDCPRLSSAGRLFELTLEHLAEPDERPLEKQVVSAVRSALDREPDGDTLVFLPGAAEIRRAEQALAPLSAERDLFVVPLHGDLPVAEQARAIEPASRRKVVLSTNVAESSITIDGVTAVVDSGLARVAGHSPWSGLPTLATAKVSRASAVQRAGRAGRTRPGRVLRLYTRGDFAARPERDMPEILRADLAELVLGLGGVGLAPDALAWLSPPPAAAVTAAKSLLAWLSAIDGAGALTAIGRRMLALPLPPRLGRVLVEGERRGVGGEAALAAALIGERDLRSSARTDFGGRVQDAARTDFSGRAQAAARATGPSDVLELLESYELAERLGFDARRLRQHGLEPAAAEAVRRAERQLARLVRDGARRPETPEERDDALLLAVLAGFVDRLARRRRPGGNELVLAGGGGAKLGEASVVRSEELLVAVAVEERALRGASGQAVVRMASGVRAEWLLDLYAERLTLDEDLLWNPTAERVEATSRLAFGSVVLEESRTPAAPGERASAVLARAVETHGAQEFLRSDALGELGERLALLARHYPAAGLPSLEAADAKTLVLSLCQGLTSFAELRAADSGARLLQGLTSGQRRLLAEQAPENIDLPGGRRLTVRYEPGKPPYVESRLQDFFGMQAGPTLCDGRVALTLHLLAPNGRAVQVTTDLSGFWRRHYPELRRALMRRYPKHAWPEDGASAAPPRRRPNPS